MDELYRSASILVRRIPAADCRRWVVTFDNHSIGAGFDRPGFGETFLADNHLSAIHVLGRGDDWYQYPDALQAMAAVRAAVAGAEAVITYGSSMGGYAAIRFAEAVGATGALSLSPQYTIDPARVPWETRWSEDAARIAFLPELAGPLRCGFKPIIVYDPTVRGGGEDHRHVILIEAETPCIAIALPYAAHPTTTFLGEVRLLLPFLNTILNGTFSPELARRAARTSRHTSTVYLATLADHQPASRSHTAIALGLKAFAVHKDSPLAALSLGRRLASLGRYDEALPYLRLAVKVTGGDPVFRLHYAEALSASGDTANAAFVAAKVIARLPDRAHLRHWYGWILAQDHQYDNALVEQKRAAAMDPGNAEYRKMLRRYRRKIAREAIAAAPPAKRPIVAAGLALSGGWQTLHKATRRLWLRSKAS